MSQGGLRRGDLVEVRRDLPTLVRIGESDGLQFMPEMLQYSGRRFIVLKPAEKDLRDMLYPLASQKLSDAVLLNDLRCDRSGHSGCRAECRLCSKEAWLRRVELNTRVTGVRESASE
jgi:hypothetical protein